MTSCCALVIAASAVVGQTDGEKVFRAYSDHAVIDEKRMSGLLQHSGPDLIAAGSSTLVRVSPDKYTVTLKYSDVNGVLTNTSGEMTRVK